ncbi:methyltransferase-like protein 25B [Anopheles nili]|uniref:methyltransferase-like protein 25B n=1 Tax=Anopheles nili TaxID=185578 RepID=UPI00237B94BC|nr:methyltransferase-like protein 25B [Anopheles nili]
MNVEAELREKIAQAYRIVQLYRGLIDAYIVDFYRLSHWNRLPPCWSRCFADIPIQQLPELLSFDRRENEVHVWPLSVLTLRALFRQLVHTRSQPTEKPASHSNVVFRQQTALFQKSVKLKKRHEVEQFAINCFHEPLGTCRTLVDVGSGQGNLARTLGYGFGFRMCGLEQEASFVHAARQKDAELWRRLTKNDPTLQQSLINPVHLQARVDLQNIDPIGFEQMVRTALNLETDGSPFQFGLIGLHPCGDLAPSLLRLFLACSGCRFVKLVCCCYMKLSVTDSVLKAAGNVDGFPLSNFCRNSDVRLSYEAREIACHAIEQYREKLRADYHELKVHAYRAAIESIIVRSRPDLQRSGLKGGIKAADVTFEEYCHRAVVGLGFSIPPEEIHSEETLANIARWEDVVKFYTLRLMFAPLIETILLYDRLLFLHEKGLKARIDVLFDPYISPRNHAITAYK